jgi:hypothetical protein
MTQKMQSLIVSTSEEIVDAVDDCLLGHSKRSVTQRLLKKFAETMETEFETLKAETLKAENPDPKA